MPGSPSQSTGPFLLPIEHPHCPKCADRMHLARIMPGPKGFDLRSFECGKCGYKVTLTIATDPMKSDKLGWLSGELKPPE
jgi:transposase-like protein